MSKESYRGGSLEEMSARGGTSIPNEAGTQQTISSEPDRRRDAAYQANTTAPDLQGVADNSAAMPADDLGLTGEVVTASGDQLPADVEAKRLGMDTAGGKVRGGMKSHTKKSDNAQAQSQKTTS